MQFDPRVERKANHICHMINTNESISISDKTRSDVFLTMRSAVSYWKDYCEKMLADNYAKRWNEWKLWHKRYPFASYEDREIVMAMLDAGLYVRDYVPQEFRESEIKFQEPSVEEWYEEEFEEGDEEQYGKL